MPRIARLSPLGPSPLRATTIAPAARPPWRLGPALRLSRRCHDHLAGLLGVAVHDALLAQGALLPVRGEGKPAYALTEAGGALLARIGLDAPALYAAPRRFAWGCTDCSERRPHLAGALGAALLARCTALGWVERGNAAAPREAERRRVTLTAAGARGLRDWIGIDATYLGWSPSVAPAMRAHGGVRPA
ncbi:MAG: hypothetical protein IT557_09285 [Alphaproteobacteria bacterium]|nr:hypothetical protein [Alphaproteobacteria bacterium]